MSKHDFAHYHAALARIGRDPVITHGTRTEALRVLSKEIAIAMDVDFVGFWAYDENRTKIISEANYQRGSDSWRDGAVLYEKDAPTYFTAVREEKVLPVENCFTSPYTAEFKDSYCVPHNIQALVDVPVLFDGEMVGIICCEVMGKTREWTTEDKFFAMFAADFVGRVLEAEQRRMYARRLEQENTRLSEEQLKALLTTLPLPIAMLDRESRYIAISDAWFEQYTFSVPDPFGVAIWDAHQHYTEEWTQRVLRAQNGESFGMEEELIKGPNNEDIWISWQLVPWHNLQGELGGVVIICEDITFRKDSEVKLRQTAKMSALGEMAGGIAHEINNPLSIMKGFIDLMQKNVARGQLDSEVFKNYLEKSSTTIGRISRIVQTMKRISRDSSHDVLMPNSVNNIIDEALDLVLEKFRNGGVQLDIEKLAIDARVNCRPVEISQVLLNLLTNSYHAVDKKGWVKVKSEIGPGVVRIIVQDSGGGISNDIKDKIFQPFFTTKDIGKGTGLGLSISRKIMENHRGKLYLDDKAKDTTFVVELPLLV